MAARSRSGRCSAAWRGFCARRSSGRSPKSSAAARRGSPVAALVSERLPSRRGQLRTGAFASLTRTDEPRDEFELAWQQLASAGSARWRSDGRARRSPCCQHAERDTSKCPFVCRHTGAGVSSTLLVGLLLRSLAGCWRDSSRLHGQPQQRSTMERTQSIVRALRQVARLRQRRQAPLVRSVPATRGARASSRARSHALAPRMVAAEASRSRLA